MMNQQAGGQVPGVLVGAQADLLLRRLQELEQVLAGQEWWLLGRALPEAQVLAEVTSLLAVARAELDGFLTQFCGRPPAGPPTTDDAADETATSTDPARIAQQRQVAVETLQMLTAALPPTTSFARQLRPFAERNGMPVVATDVLGIVADRIADAQEALQSPPS
jgi:hypothetical protein